MGILITTMEEPMNHTIIIIFQILIVLTSFEYLFVFNLQKKHTKKKSWQADTINPKSRRRRRPKHFFGLFEMAGKNTSQHKIKAK